MKVCISVRPIGCYIKICC